MLTEVTVRLPGARSCAVRHPAVPTLPTGPDAQRGDESGITPTFSAIGLEGPSSVTVTLRVSPPVSSLRPGDESTVLISGTASDPYTITVDLVDEDDTHTGVGSKEITVSNLAPALSGLAATDVDENGSTIFSGAITDPGILDTFTLAVDWGDGSALETFNYPAGTTTFSETHQYLDDNPSGTVSDDYTLTVHSPERVSTIASVVSGSVGQADAAGHRRGRRHRRGHGDDNGYG